MGQSYASFERENFFNSFNFEKKYNDPKFGDLFVFRNIQTNVPVLVQELSHDVFSQTEAKKYSDRLRFQHQYILDIYNVFETSGEEWVDIIGNEDLGLLGSDVTKNLRQEKILLMVFEFFESDLSRQMQQMIDLGQRFSEENLWNMATQLFSALATCQEHGIPNGGITTTRVLIDLEGDYQISLVQPLVNFMKNKKNAHMGLFKADTKALAGCFLSASLLEIRGDQTNDNYTKGGIYECRQYYSPEWCDFLQACLDENSQRRPDPMSIHRSNFGTLYIDVANPNKPIRQSIVDVSTLPLNPGLPTTLRQVPTGNPYSPFNPLVQSQMVPNLGPKVHDVEYRSDQQQGLKVQTVFPKSPVKKAPQPPQVVLQPQYTPQYAPQQYLPRRPMPQSYNPQPQMMMLFHHRCEMFEFDDLDDDFPVPAKEQGHELPTSSSDGENSQTKITNDRQDDSTEEEQELIDGNLAAEVRQLREEVRRMKKQLEDNGDVTSSGGKGFSPREASDPLSKWFPFVHTAAIDTGAEGGYMVCIGPPSASATDWLQPEFHVGGRGFRIQPQAMRKHVDLGDNVLVQGMVHRHQEMLVAQCPLGTVDVAAAGKELASLLRDMLRAKDWEVFAVGVGVWVACAFLQELHSSANGAWTRCVRFHVIGFPRPDSKGKKNLPEGGSVEDETLAKSAKPLKPLIPQKLHVGHLIECAGQSRQEMKDWFELTGEVGNLPMVALPGNVALLSQPRLRHDAFWVMSKLGLGTYLPAGYDSAAKYREVCIRDGLPLHQGSLFDEVADTRLLEMRCNSDMKPFQKHLTSGRKAHAFCDSFSTGQCGADNGLDLRYWADMSTEKNLSKNSGKGCRTVSLVRFSWRAQVGAAPSDGTGIHGGAIGALMDEATAECMKFWIQPQCTTRKIEHQIMKMCLPYQTYTVDCTVGESKNEKVIYVVKGTMKDLAGEICCKTTAEMVDMPAMSKMLGSK